MALNLCVIGCSSVELLLWCGLDQVSAHVFVGSVVLKNNSFLLLRTDLIAFGSEGSPVCH
jgi:hypothetical protein